MYPYIVVLGEKIPSYVVCSGIGLIVSYFVFSLYISGKDSYKQYMESFLLSLIGMILCARIFGILSQVIDMLCGKGELNIYKAIKNSGIVFYGGLFGFVYSFKILCNIKKCVFNEVRNICAIVIPLFHFFGRIGCYFAGCCYGIVCENIFGVLYRVGLENIYKSRIPLQLYEAGVELIVFFLMVILYKSNVKINLLKMYFLIYGIWRMLAEELRGDSIRGVFWGVSFSQVISIIVILIICCSYIKKYILNERR